MPCIAQSRFTPSMSSGEMVVFDSKTGLTWRRCVEGQSWNGTTCTGTSTTYTHEQALAYAKAQTGWRLPSVKELSSLVDRTTNNPAIDSITFPGVGHGGPYWTSTPYAGSNGYAWSVDFTYGLVNIRQRVMVFNGYIRLVR